MEDLREPSGDLVRDVLEYVEAFNPHLRPQLPMSSTPG